MKAAAERSARVQLQRIADRQWVDVVVPRDTDLKDLAVINDTVVEKIIKDLTGCSCLSGAIDVVFKHEFEDVLRVELPARGIG
jgi:hypothetical protein